MRYVRVIGVLSAMLLAVGCGGHDCKAFNEAVCKRASECHFQSCQVDACPGNEQANFSSCIAVTNAASCDNLVDAALNCKIDR